MAYVELLTHAKLAMLWAPCASHVMACARLPDSILPKKTQDTFWGATRGPIAFGITIDALLVSNPFVLSGLALESAFHPQLSLTSFFSKLLSEASGSAYWLLGFSTLSSLLTTCQEPAVARVSTSVSLCMGETK